MSSFVSNMLRPASKLLNQLQLRAKLFVVFAIALLPILWLSGYLLQRANTDFDIADGEFVGVTFSTHQMDLIIQTQKHRGQTNLKLAGQQNDAELEKTRAALKTDIDLVTQDVKSKPEWQLAAAWEPLVVELNQLASGQISTVPSENMRQHTALIKRLQQLALLSAEKSGLLLDPEANTYFLIDTAIQKLPVWVEQIAQLRGLGAGYIKSNAMALGDKSLVAARLDALKTAQDAVDDSQGPLQRAGETIPAELTQATDASKAFAVTAQKNLLSEAVNGDAVAYFEQGTNGINKALALQQIMLTRLNLLLEQRLHHLRTSEHLIFVGSLVCALLTTCFLLAFYRDLMTTVTTLRESAQAVSSGDLTRQIHVDGSDELALTGQTLETMNLKLSSMVANVRSNSHMVSQVGQGLAANISDLSARTEQQASSLEETSASIEDLADTVKKNADSASNVDRMASTVCLIAESSGETMLQAVKSMQKIQSSAVKVQDIVSIIDSIAFQTNILALNAAVEAARAGEQGRGFAVVAAEVRNLAQRSAASAKEIRILIDESVHQVKGGVQQINDVNKTLSDIVEGIRDLAGSINQISLASVEQSNGLNQISEALRNLDEITQSNGQMAEQAKYVAISLEERAGMLATSVAAFKLRQGTADEAYTLVKRAVAVYRQKGQQALTAITADTQRLFADKDMYVFAFNREGQYLAFGGNAAKLKVNLFQVPGLDGKKLVADAFNVVGEGGWVDYQITNPVSGNIEHKTSYIEVVAENIVIGCGIYKT
ncbi:methyl-accepting chemotaxis protein [Undibacterium sp. RuRC25W]|uniref:methyl-accepting chemotaxis protein n=1 Tax=Undibacterium sp. RuRC25W TaxID=3413047 RepID=UPI003BF23820